MSNSKVSGPSAGNSTASRSKSGSLIADSFCSSFTCVEAVHQQLALDLRGDVLAKAGLDQLPRRPARPKSRHVRRGHQLGELLVEVPLDVLARNRDGDVTLARAAGVDLHLQGKRLRLPLRSSAAADASEFNTASGSSRLSVSDIIVPMCGMSLHCQERVMGFEPTTTTLATSCSTN